jgi:ankyrin repeat protein
MKALKWASKHGLVKVTQISIDASSCPECRTNNLYKAVSRAAANGHAAVVELLLQTPGIEANQQNYQSGTSVLNAVNSRSTETVSCFLRCKNLKIDLNNGNNFRRNPLILASKFDTPYIAKLLLTSPAIHVDYRDYNAATALHYAARFGSEETVRSLLECGANPDPHDSGGITPLFHAARRGNISTVKMLLEAGADPHQTGSNGCHPLGAARDLGHIEAVEGFARLRPAQFRLARASS